MSQKLSDAELQALKESSRQQNCENLARVFRGIGFLARLAVYAALFGLLYVWWPKDIGSRPLASLTLSDLSGLALRVIIFFGLLGVLFNPSDDKQIRHAWGWVGLFLIGTTVCTYVYFNYVR
jgi:hypothetical protein